MFAAPVGAMVLFLALLEAPVENPWKARVGPALAQVERNPSPSACRKALETAYRADDWAAAERVAKMALTKHANNQDLLPLIARALWRGGDVADAEAALAKIDPLSDDPIALSTRINIALARGDADGAGRAAEKLAARESLSAADYSALVAASFTMNRLDGLDAMITRTLSTIDVSNGYPEIYLKEQFDGLADFLKAVGPAPLNQITAYGDAPMPVSSLNLPLVNAYINGKGPYRLIVDTGGSVLLSLDRDVAKEIGLREIAKATIRGVAGTDDSMQSIADDVRFGNVRMTRVMTRVFDVGKALMYSADGILGTGIFHAGRMTMDFERGVLIVGESSEKDGAGEELPIRIVGDGKILPLIRVNGLEMVGLLDSGADAVALSPATLKTLYPDYETMEVSVGAMGVGSSSTPTIQVGPGVRLSLPGKEYANIGGIGLNVLDETLSPMLGIQADILLGMPIMRDMQTYTVDYPRCKSWVTWLSAK